MSMEATPNGTLMKNMSRQLTWSVKTPPSSGPATEDSTTDIDRYPM